MLYVKATGTGYLGLKEDAFTCGLAAQSTLPIADFRYQLQLQLLNGLFHSEEV